MKKRNEEGFALVYVAIVIVILCSIATAIMSYTLRNLQAQENMIQRMQNKYVAMGEIERVVAELDAYRVPELTDNEHTYSNEDDCMGEAIAYLLDYIDSFNYSVAATENTPVRHLSITPSVTTDHQKCTLSITARYDSIQVVAEIVISPNITTHYHCDYKKNADDTYVLDANGNRVKDSEWYHFSLDPAFLAFDSYRIIAGGDST